MFIVDHYPKSSENKKRIVHFIDLGINSLFCMYIVIDYYQMFFDWNTRKVTNYLWVNQWGIREPFTRPS